MREGAREGQIAEYNEERCQRGPDFEEGEKDEKRESRRDCCLNNPNVEKYNIWQNSRNWYFSAP